LKVTFAFAMSPYAPSATQTGKKPRTGGTVRGFSGDEQEWPAQIPNFLEKALFLTTTPPELNNARAALR
jgi:hypothetical protein